jgi:hypothetical protein
MAAGDLSLVDRALGALANIGDLAEIKTNIAVIRALMESVTESHRQHLSEAKIIHDNHQGRLVVLETDKAVNMAASAIRMRWVSVISGLIGAASGFTTAFLERFVSHH